jgi:N-acetylneuraminic acid mutarotase
VTRRELLAGAVGFGVIAAAAPLLAQEPRGRWTTAPPLARGWEEVMGAAVRGKVYVFEGLEAFPRGYSGMATLPVWRPYGGLEVFDPATGQWAPRSPMPIPAHHVAVAVHDDKLYVFGGFVGAEPLGGWSSVANVFAYDPATDRWSPWTPMPTPRGGAHAAEVGGRIFVIGGYTTSAHPRGAAGSDMGSTEAYDPASDTWTIRQSMPTPRNHHATGAIGDKVYVAGGRIGAPFAGAASHLNLTEEYDPARNLWSRKAAMPTARSGLGYGVWNGRLFVFGGEVSPRGPTHVFAEVEAYDPAADRWETYAPMPTARHAPAVAVVGDRIYVVSGNTRVGGGSASPVNEIFEPAGPPA